MITNQTAPRTTTRSAVLPTSIPTCPEKLAQVNQQYLNAIAGTKSQEQAQQLQYRLGEINEGYKLNQVGKEPDSACKVSQLRAISRDYCQLGDSARSLLVSKQADLLSQTLQASGKEQGIGQTIGYAARGLVSALRF